MVQGETYSGKADFIAQVVKATDTVFGVLVVVVLDETKAANINVSMIRAMRVTCKTYPLQRPVE